MTETMEPKTFKDKVEDLAWAIRNKKWDLEEKWRKKSWVFKLMMTILIAVFVGGSILVGGGMAMAEGEGDDWIEDLSGLKQVCASMFIYGYRVMMATAGDGISDFLKFANEDLTISNKMWDSLAVFGLGMCIVYFLIDLNKTLIMLSSDFTAKSALAPFLKLCLGVGLISHGRMVVSAIMSFNNGIIDAATGWETFADATADLSGMKEFFENLGFFQALASMILFLIYWVVSLVITLIFIYNTFSRKIEMILRVGLTPVSLGDIYNGEGGNAVRYLKKLLALVLYGACFIAIVLIGGSMVMSTLKGVMSVFSVDVEGAGETLPGIVAFIAKLGVTAGDGLSAVLGLIIGLLLTCCICLAEIGALGMAKQACNDVLGV